MSKIPVDVGRLDKRIVIQKRTVTNDNLKNQLEQWTDYHACWASVNGVTNREYLAARQQHEENVVTFKVRCCNALKNINKRDFRIVFSGRIYDIMYVDNVLFSDSIMNIKGAEHV